MKINIYKEEKLFEGLTASENNPLALFFINKEFISEYEIRENPVDKNRHFLKYFFNDRDYLIDIHNILKECILNNYKIEIEE